MALEKLVGSNISPTTAALIKSLQFQSPSSYISLPVGTTAQRPTGISYGTIRFNTTKDQAEIYNTQTGIADWNTIGSETGLDGGDAFIRTNGTTITKNITLGPTANSDQKYTHGFLMGDITIDSGITVTIETGSQLIVIDEQPQPFIIPQSLNLYNTYFPGGAFLVLDATNYISGNTWADTSGNNRNFTINPEAFISNGKFFDFNGNYGIAKNSADLSLSNTVTYVVVTRVRKSSSGWRTLTRSYTSDHHVIFEDNSWRIGMYDNDGAGFLDTTKLQTSLPYFNNANGDFDIMIWRWTDSDNPTYDLNVNGQSFGTITTANARYNRGFGSIGGYHDGVTNTNVNTASQYWGDIKFFAAFNRRLSNQEVANVNLALSEYVTDVSTKMSSLSLWELDLRSTTPREYTSGSTFSSTDTGFTRYTFSLTGGLSVSGLMQNHTSASSTAKVPVTFSSPKTKVFFITWYYKSSYNSGTTGGLLSATPTLFSQNYTIHPGGVYRDGSSTDSLIFETNAGTSEFTTAAGTRYRISQGLNNYASGWHTLGYLFDSTSTSVGIYVNGNFIQNITHSGTFGNFTGAQLAPWNFYSGYTTTDACMAYSACIDASQGLSNKQIKQISDRGIYNLMGNTRMGSIIGI